MSERRVILGCIITSKRRKDDTFKVHSIKSNKDFILRVKKGTYIPFTIGDAIFCICMRVGDSDIFDFVQINQAELGQSRQDIITCFIRALPNSGMTGKKSDAIYDYLEDLLKKEEYESIKGVGYLLSYLANVHVKMFTQSLKTPATNVLLRATITANGRKIPCLSLCYASNLLLWWRENTDMRRLYCLGLTKDEIDECRMSPLDLYEQILVNPYCIPQLDLKKCADLDKRNGRDPNVYDVEYGNFTRSVYYKTKNNKYTCVNLRDLPRYDITTRMRTILQEDFRVIFETMPTYKEDDTDPINEEYVYLLPCHEAEKGVADYLRKIVSDDPYFNFGDPIFPDDRLDYIQKGAVKLCMDKNCVIIEGPAGSGKTTIIKTLMYNFDVRCVKYFVTSFTGKAVHRAKEANCIEDAAATMHRVLYGGYDVEFDVLIIDEISMVDVELTWFFLEHFKYKKFKIIMIGDPNQLHPISWGSFFCSCIDSRTIPMTRLESVYRSKNKDGSPDGIIINATKIVNYPYNETFAFEPASNVQFHVTKSIRIKDMLFQYKAKGYKQNEITVISPYRNLKIGGDRCKYLELLNAASQIVWRSDSPKVNAPMGKTWYLGDRVSMTTNVNPLELSNGQEGEIVHIDNECVHVAFKRTIISKSGTVIQQASSEDVVSYKIEDSEELDDSTVRAIHIITVKMKHSVTEQKKTRSAIKKDEGDDLPELNTNCITLSYAVTIHGSQGSEWKICLFQVPAESNIESDFLNRNMIYVALTRASEELIVLDPAGKSRAIIEKKAAYRCEMLMSRLRVGLPTLYPYKKKVLIEVETQIEEACDDDDFYDF